MGHGSKLRIELIQGYNVCELMVGLNALFGSFIPCRSLHRRGERSPRPRPIHVGSGDVDMQSVLAAFVEELSNERIELKCVNDLALETLLRLKLLMRCLHINHEQLVPGRCFVPYRIAVKHKPQLAPVSNSRWSNMTVVCFALLFMSRFLV